MNLLKVNLMDLKPNPMNPPQRVDKKLTSYKLLRNSIKRAGQIEPITISSDNTIINGTKRTAVTKDLGLDTIYANRLNSKGVI